jgi:hypothetical protein
MPNCSLYKNGVQAALNAGKYNPANAAACKLRQTLAGVKSHGLGKGGRRTRRTRRASSRTRRASSRTRRDSSRRASTRRRL